MPPASADDDVFFAAEREDARGAAAPLLRAARATGARRVLLAAVVIIVDEREEEEEEEEEWYGMVAPFQAGTIPNRAAMEAMAPAAMDFLEKTHEPSTKNGTHVGEVNLADGEVCAWSCHQKICRAKKIL